MEFGKHVDKGLWAFADKALPVVYGVGYIFLVIRVLPQQEFGALGIIQSFFGVITAIGYAVSLLPLTKFVAEKDNPTQYIVVSFLILCSLTLVSSILILVFNTQITRIFDPLNESNISTLFRLFPLLLITSFYRNFAIGYLQVKYQVKKIFFIDVIYFGGVLLSIYFLQKINFFHSAQDVLHIMIIMFSMSSLFSIGVTLRQISFAKKIDREVWIDVWRFGKYSLGGNVLYSIFSQLDVFLVSSMAGLVSVAAYNVAKTFTKVFDVVGQVLSMFLLPFSSRYFNQNEIQRLTVTAEKSICFSTLLLLPVIILLFFCPEIILSILFNGKYDSCENVLRVFSIIGLLVPWNVVAGSYITGIGKTKEGLVIGSIHLVIAGTSLTIGSYMFGIEGAAVTFLLSFFIYTLLLVYYINVLIPIRIIGVISRVKDVHNFFVKNW